MKTNLFLGAIKGALIGVMTAIIGILLLAGAVKLFTLSEMGIKTANQFIKTIAIFLGCITTFKQEKGFIKGLLLGAVFCVLLHLIFTLIGSFIGIKSFLFDLMFCLVVGTISGIISVNVKETYDI